MLSNRKITTYAKNIKDLADTPNDNGFNAETLKEFFDGRGDEEIKASINGIIDDLSSTEQGGSGADNIGVTPLIEGGAETLQGVLSELKSGVGTHADDKNNPHEVTKEQVGLGSVDNTADIDKPISNAVASEIETLTSEIDSLQSGLNSLELTLDTEMLGVETRINDLSDEMSASLDTKVDKIAGKTLTTNDFTDELKANYDEAVLKGHTHENRALLDGYTNTNAQIQSAIDTSHTHTNKEFLDGLAESDLHSHSNKEFLDGLSPANLHEHTNKELLDGLSASDLHTHANKNALDTMPSGGVVNVLGNDDTTIPTSKAVVDAIGEAGGGDMMKSTYDTNNNGIVDNAERLNGKQDTEFASATHTHKELLDRLSASDLHTHANKTLLDGITSASVHTHTNKSLLDGLTSSDIHTHGNKAVLDAITSANVHIHTNKSAIDTIPSGGVVQTLGTTHNTVPTSKAVRDAINTSTGTQVTIDEESVSTLTLYPAKEWVSSSNTFPHDLTKCALIVCNGHLYLMGGNIKPYYHFEIDTKSELPTLPVQVEKERVIVFNNALHIISDNSHYKRNGTSWTSVSTPPYSCNNHSMVVLNNELHIMGGGVNDTVTQITKHYKWNGTSWTSVSTLPFKHRTSCAVVFNNEIHILGSQSTDAYTKHYKWNGTSWTSVSTLPVNFYWGHAYISDNLIHIVKGKTIYKLQNGNWIVEEKIARNVDSAGFTFYDGEMCTAGGDSSMYTAFSYTRTIYAEKKPMY